MDFLGIDDRSAPKSCRDSRRLARPLRARTGLAVPAGNSAAAASTVNLGHVDMTRPNRDN
jgi:hypothetical protein